MAARICRLILMACLLVSFLQPVVYAAQWYSVLVDKNNAPPKPVMDEVWGSIRVTGDLFTRYKLILPEIVTIRVATTQDSYANALMHLRISRAIQRRRICRNEKPVIVYGQYFSQQRDFNRSVERAKPVLKQGRG